MPAGPDRMIYPSPEQIASSLDVLLVKHGYGNRFQGFQNLMRLRIRDILLVSSLYDLYLFEEDGRLYELIRNEYEGFNLGYSPELTRVSSGREAIKLAKEERRFDLIITTLHIDDMHAAHFARLVKEEGLNIPVVLLTHDNRELQHLLLSSSSEVFDKVFVWQGDFRIIIAIIKYLEDRMNVAHDASMVGVQTIVVVEDNVKTYSSLLPIIYTEVLEQSRRLISEGINLTHKLLRMRARPKILLCTTFEEAWAAFEQYRDFMLGIISDIELPKDGRLDGGAGLLFAQQVKLRQPDVPMLLLSNNGDNQAKAHAEGAAFGLKDSPSLQQELRHFMMEYFSFGDFVFRVTGGMEVGRASDLRQLEELLGTVPVESIVFHAERNHFSNWLKARTEFWLAHSLRPRKVSDYPSGEALRSDLIASLREYRAVRQRGIIAEFSRDTFDPESSFARIGGGSLGGKGRGLGFISTIINDYDVRDRFEGIQISVPPAVVVGTDVFDDFVDSNDLRSFAISCTDDREITRRFVEASYFPDKAIGSLVAFLDMVRSPLAVRSSSLLEDSQYHPFAGVYETYMLPNNQTNPLVRLNELLTTIKRVYASTYYQGAKNYIRMTSYRQDEEKMAVIIQRLVGSRRGAAFYPNFAGVARSYNFYPLPPQKPSDGTVAVALGLGKMVVEGGNAVRFCPRYPTDLIQFYSVDEAIATTQREFFALRMEEIAGADDWDVTTDLRVSAFGLDVAEADGALAGIGSTYSPDNDVVVDGLSRDGIRLVTFGPLLRGKMFPLPAIIELLLDMGTWGMGTPVEIEFAVNLSTPAGRPKEFGLLQMRPLVLHREIDELNVEDVSRGDLICQSSRVLGNGVIDDIRDIVMVDYHQFDRSKSRLVASEVAQYNAQLLSEGKPYLLVGVGRWGTLDPWLGIPVAWNEICGAKAIVESPFRDVAVAPSQGSHFFQNITSFMVGYFSVEQNESIGFLDWEWLLSQPALSTREFVRLVRFDDPLLIRINGHTNKGIILKPGATHGNGTTTAAAGSR